MTPHWPRRERARAALENPAGASALATGAEPQTAALAGWALMHRLAAPWLTGNVPIRIRSHWRAVGSYLFAAGQRGSGS